MEVQTPQAEVVPAVPLTPEEKPKIKQYIKSIGPCKKCGEPVLFIPQLKGSVCAKCIKVEGDITSDNPYEYLTEANRTELAKIDKKPKTVLHYTNPRSNPDYFWPQRNAPCDCGSGKKFKKCCLATKEAAKYGATVAMYDAARTTAVSRIANENFLIRSVFNHFKANNWKEIEAAEIPGKVFTEEDLAKWPTQ